jgi:RimJ/RimL family protein N-acetyltransferase
MYLLSTKRLGLRPFTKEDITLLYALHSNAEVMKYIPCGIRTLEETKLDLQEDILHQEKYGFGKWAVFLKDTNEFVGRAGWAVIPESNEVEVGFKFFPQFWSQGFATEILNALLEWAEINIANTQVAFALIDNKASQHVIEKVGMTFLRYDEYDSHPIIVYGRNI